ncbi:MAG: hypothetical protein WBN68_19250, partial [Sedimenticolaceae bacterium]
VSATPSPPSAACAPPQPRLEPLATANGEISGLAIGLAVIIPSSLRSIVQIRREDWSDIAVARDPNPAPVEET